MRLVLVQFMVAVALAAPARADDIQVTRYHNEVIAVDTLAMGLVIGGDHNGAPQVRTGGFAVGIVGAPALHLAHRNLRSAAESLLLRVTIPVATAWLGDRMEQSVKVCALDDVGAPGGEASCGSTSGSGAAWGFAVGLFAVMVIDASRFAVKEERRPEREWAPAIAVGDGSVRVSVAARF